MDGNRRYAGQLGKTRSFGHSMGAEVTEKVIEWCYEIGVKQLTLYAFFYRKLSAFRRGS